MKNISFATRWNADLLDNYYESWLSDPNSVDPKWQAFFEGFQLGLQQTPPFTGVQEDVADSIGILQARVIGAIYAFRSIGHTEATFNPLLDTVPFNPRLSLDRLGIEEEHLDQEAFTGNYLGGLKMQISELFDRLRKTYCGTIGVEYIHIQETPQRRWLQARMEPNCNQPDFPADKKKRILRKVSESETFENFLQNRYVGQKRFGIEGAETTIAALDALVEYCPQMGVSEIVMGMAHRGRLNVLASIMGKSYEFIFKEFSPNYIPQSSYGDGDVKYHLGYETVRRTQSGSEVEIRLAANPSHLEAVNPVVEGKARARQRLVDDTKNRSKVLPFILHGDAAIAGQGITAETFNLSQLEGYRTGGTIHFVINNQIGFTTDPTDARSSTYCTDIAKMVEAPIFHVNGDDPLSVVMITELALEFRQAFQKDVVIDMYCYRKHGHNEADEPGFTQPLLYKNIKKHTSVSVQLAKKLIRDKTLTTEETKQLKEEYRNILDETFERDKQKQEQASTKSRKRNNGANGNNGTDKFQGSTAVFQPKYHFRAPNTGISVDRMNKVVHALTNPPEGFNINPKIKRQLDTKANVYKEDKGIDWAFAEQLAFGSLVSEKTPVRLSGQDSERGTFSQRHAAWYDSETRRRYCPFSNIEQDQATFCVHNSCLSEAAVLGFDFGYAVEHPRMLCIWEAQFGDFVNGAQVIIDQFITSSESKWQRVSGLTMLLPHGYEGQGPEHSSARLERFLQSCAEDNIQVCNLSTPAQYFHCLRRQMRQPYRKPLVLMSPKSLLRHKSCISYNEAFQEGHFMEMLDDPEPPNEIERVVVCSGKLFYELIAERDQNKQYANTAILRLEQFYPFNKKRMAELVEKYAPKTLVWCQEEPKNMGAWQFVQDRIESATGMRPYFAGRKSSASPAVGSLALHKKEQQDVIDQAFSVGAPSDR